MKQHRKLVVLSASILLTVGLAACGNGQLNSDDSTEPLYKVNIKKNDINYDNENKMWSFDANKNGTYNLPLKINKDGKLTVTSDGDPNTNFGTKTYNVKKGETLNIPLSIKNDTNTPGANFYIKTKDMNKLSIFIDNPNYIDTSSTSSSSEMEMSPSKVKSALNPLLKIKDNENFDIVDSIKINGFTTDKGGGAVIIKTKDFDNLVTKDTINKIIVNTCQLLAKNSKIIGTGINIKIVSPDAANGNNVVTGYAHVDANQLTDINKNNVSSAVQDYQNKGTSD